MARLKPKQRHQLLFNYLFTHPNGSRHLDDWWAASELYLLMKAWGWTKSDAGEALRSLLAEKRLERRQQVPTRRRPDEIGRYEYKLVIQ